MPPPDCEQLLAQRTNLRTLGNDTHPVHCYMLADAARDGQCESYYFSDIFLEKEGNLNGKIFSLAEFLPFKKNHNENYNQVVTLVRFVYFGSCASFSIMSGLI